MHVVGDADQIGGIAGDLLGLSDHDGEHVAEIAGTSTDGDEHRPIGVDETDRELSGDVVAGEHRHDAVELLGIGGVDVEHVGSSVVGEPERTVQHSGNPEIVDEATVAEGELCGLVLDSAGADAVRGRRFGDLVAGRQQLDRLDDLGVAGAPTEVGAQPSLDRRSVEIAALLIDQCLGPNEDARCGEAALKRSFGGEGPGEAPPIVFVEPLEGHDLLAIGLLHRDQTRLDRLAIHQNRATAALSGR